MGTTLAGFSESSAARSAARITFGLFGSTTTSAPGAAWMPASSSYVDGFIVEPPSTTSTPSSRNSRFTPSPLATATTAQAACSPGAASPASRALRSATCSCMSATSKRDTSPADSNRPTAPSGSSVCTWTRSVRSSPTTSTESPRCSSSGVKYPASRPSPVTAKFVQ